MFPRCRNSLYHINRRAPEREPNFGIDLGYSDRPRTGSFMTLDQGLIFGLLAITMALFFWARWRYDLIAVLALLAAVFLQLVPAETAFAGFGHPAVITVAAVLIISRALQASGLVESLVKFLGRSGGSTMGQIGATGGLALVFSCFMNNIGALALMLPVALRQAAKFRRPPAKILMPLSFATLLGGLVTMIGTPPNIIIATFRTEAVGAPFAMFDFAAVGLPVALCGLAYLVFIGWRLLPKDRGGGGGNAEANRFSIEEYLIEALVPENSTLAGSQVRDIERLCDNEVTVMTIIREKSRLLAPLGTDHLEAGDILILEGDPTALQPLFGSNKLRPTGTSHVEMADLSSEQIDLMEAVVMPGATIEGKSMRGLKMHEKYSINLLAVARQDLAPKTRLGSVRFKPGDVLLLQGELGALQEIMTALGCLPLASRDLRIGRRHRASLTLGIFALAILASAFGFLPVQVAFVAAVATMILADCLTLREAYDAIEWPIILLLGCLLPLGKALQDTGGTAMIADGILGLAAQMPLWGLVALLVLASMLLSDLIHNSPTAVLMAPIAVAIADGLGLPPDGFLMAVAVGAASPYLTPVGHQSNTLVMAPAGYRFGDYWRMGLPLDLLILVVAVPLILWVWIP